MTLLGYIFFMWMMKKIFYDTKREDCPSCGGNGVHYYKDYDEQRKREYDISEPCSVCSGAGKVFYVKTENNIKYYRGSFSDGDSNGQMGFIPWITGWTVIIIVLFFIFGK